MFELNGAELVGTQSTVNSDQSSVNSHQSPVIVEQLAIHNSQLTNLQSPVSSLSVSQSLNLSVSQSLSLSVSQSLPLIRLATHDDVPGIATLVNEYARRGDLLPRSAQAISHGIGNWFVAEWDGVIVGCVSLLRYTSGLVEVRSLAVSDSVQGKGIGKKLVQALISEAQHREIPTLFALTRAVPFFLACGFTITDKSHFPEKVWHDCQKCPLIHNCDETAVVLELGREA